MDYMLIKRILDLSESDKWKDAKKEWIEGSIFNEEAYCLCGHPIFENCEIINIKNNNKAIVGNVCVQKFFDIETEKYFNDIRKIRKDSFKSVSLEMLDYCLSKKIITDEDYYLYSKFLRRRKLNDYIINIRHSVNSKILSNHLRIKDVPREIPSGVRFDVLKRDRWKCVICKNKLKYSLNSPFGDVVAEIDHIHPFSKRFTYINGHENIHEMSNLQSLCKRCNLLKSNKKNKDFMSEKTTMNLREQAKAYEPQAKTYNIADLARVDIDSVELLDKEGTTKEGEKFTYKYIVIDGQEYRVPLPVIGQLKTQLEENPDLKAFKVKKSGAGMATQYTVIPLGGQ